MSEVAKGKFNTIAHIFLVAAMSLFVLSFPFQNKFSIIAFWIILVPALVVGIVNRKFYLHWIFLFPTVLFAIRTVSFVFFTPPEIKFSQFEVCSSLLTMPLVFSLFRLSERQVQIFLQLAFCMLLTGVIFCWLLFIQHIGFSEEHKVWDALREPKAHNLAFLVRPLFWHPSFIAVTLSFIIPLAFYLRVNKKISTVFLVITLLLSIGFIFVSGARIGIVVSVLLLSFGFVYYFKHLSASEKFILHDMVALILVLAYLSPYSLTYDLPRKQLQTWSLEIIKENPKWGSGFYSMEKTIHARGEEAGYKFNHFHNAYLDETVQFGVAGGLFLVAFIIATLVVAIRRKDFLLLAFLVIYVPFMYVESPFMSVKGIMPMMFWLCFLVSSCRERRPICC
jgi:O-antigen ligase